MKTTTIMTCCTIMLFAINASAAKLVEGMHVWAIHPVEIRTEPAFEGTPVEERKKGSDFIVIKIGQDWIKVATQSHRTGWVAKSWVTDDQGDLQALSGTKKSDYMCSQKTSPSFWINNKKDLKKQLLENCWDVTQVSEVENTIYSYVKSIPKSDIKANIMGYTALLAINPKNKIYIQKIGQYGSTNREQLKRSPTAASGKENNISKQEIAKCAAVEGDLSRLECFDVLARRYNLHEPQVQVTASGGNGDWHVRSSVNPIDDTKTVEMVLQASSGSSSWGKNIFMIVRCKSNKTELYINWQDYLGSEAYVLTRVGNKKAMTLEWSISTDSKATFYPSSPIWFLKEMMKTDKLISQVTPYNESPITAIFNTKDMNNAIKPLREECGW